MKSKNQQVRIYDYNKINEVDIESRYNLYIKFNNSKENKVRILMMNPSYADKRISDKTTNAVINEFQDYYGDLGIINLSPRITTNTDELKPLEHFENLYNKHYVIDKMTDENYDMVLATGDFYNQVKNKSVKEQMYDIYQELLNELKHSKSNIKLYAYGITVENKCGMHFASPKVENKIPVKVGWDDDDKQYILEHI